MNPNSIGFWLPELVEAAKCQNFFKISKTTVIKVPITLLQLTRIDYQNLTPATIKILDEYCMKAFDLDINEEYFIKTGTYSSKFDFRNAYVKGEKEVRELGEYLMFIHFNIFLRKEERDREKKSSYCYSFFHSKDVNVSRSILFCR